MRDTHQVLSSNDEKMSSDYSEEAMREVEEAGFAMREELKEAEAAVEACYRRRARRAGLVEMLPSDRSLSEKELDTQRAARRRDWGQGQAQEGGRVNDHGGDGS
jgi:hypothetical protein